MSEPAASLLARWMDQWALQGEGGRKKDWKGPRMSVQLGKLKSVNPPRDKHHLPIDELEKRGFGVVRDFCSEVQQALAGTKK